MSVERPALKCNCGQRIQPCDVLSTGYELRPVGPNYVYVKFRCSRCRRLGEHLVEQSQWDWALLRPEPPVFVAEEDEKFRRLPPITMEEVLDFHFAIEAPDVLKRLK